jgi:hypothetical protein
VRTLAPTPWRRSKELREARPTSCALGQGVGTKGGGTVKEGVWVHQRLQQRGLEATIAAVLTGERPAIG